MKQKIKTDYADHIPKTLTVDRLRYFILQSLCLKGLKPIPSTLVGEKDVRIASKIQIKCMNVFSDDLSEKNHKNRIQICSKSLRRSTTTKLEQTNRLTLLTTNVHS